MSFSRAFRCFQSLILLVGAFTAGGQAKESAGWIEAVGTQYASRHALPVLLHTGTTFIAQGPIDTTLPRHLDPVAIKYPDCPINPGSSGPSLRVGNRGCDS